MHRSVSTLALLLYVVWSVLALLYTPLIDFWPKITSLHGFLERRVLLVSILPWILVFAIVLLFFYPLSNAKVPLLFSLALALTFLPAVLISPIKSYALVEAGLFFFFFTAIVWWGQVIAVTGLANKALVVMLLLTATSMMLYAITSLYMLFFSLIDRVDRLDTILPWGFLNIRYWSHLATWLLPLLPLTVLHLPLGKYGLWRIGGIFAGGVWWWIVFLSVARGSIVSIFVATLIVLLLFRRNAGDWLRWMLVFLCAGILIWWVVAFLLPWALDLPPSMQKSIGFSSSGRLLLWREAWEMSMQNFPFGMGVFSWVIHTPLGEGHKEMGIFGHPHNMYLFWAAEYGWVMILTLLSITLILIKKWGMAFKAARNKRADMMILLGLTASVLAALVHSIFSSIFLMPASMLVGGVVMSTLWGVVGSHSVVYETPSRYMSSSIPKVFLILIFCFLGFFWQWLVCKNYVDIDRAIKADDLYIPGHGLRRFWDNAHVPNLNNN